MQLLLRKLFWWLPHSVYGIESWGSVTMSMDVQFIQGDLHRNYTQSNNITLHRDGHSWLFSLLLGLIRSGFYWWPDCYHFLNSKKQEKPGIKNTCEFDMFLTTLYFTSGVVWVAVLCFYAIGLRFASAKSCSWEMGLLGVTTILDTRCRPVILFMIQFVKYDTLKIWPDVKTDLY